MTQLIRFPTNLTGQLENGCVCTIGSYDALHRGHQAIFLNMVEAAQKKNCKTAVVTFYPHPRSVIRFKETGKRQKGSVLTQLRERLALLTEYGVDYLYMVHFTSAISEWSGQQFVDEVLAKHLNCNHLLIGADHTIGKNREGTPDKIQILCRERGWGFEVIPPILQSGSETKIGTRAIIDALKSGEIGIARDFLGRDVSFYGRVVPGDGRGKKIGFPTANLHLSQVPPLKPGVYLGRGIAAFGVGSKSGEYDAVVNVGYRPTFAGEDLRIEVHFYGADMQDFYHQKMKLTLLDYIREERKFNSVDELSLQIAKDITQAKILLDNSRIRDE